jgi:hypothetical protein
LLLSEEQALAPHEECYHRLLAFGLDEANDLAEAYVKTNSLTSLYDSVLIPTVTLAEMDAQRDELDAGPFGRLWYGEPNAIRNAISFSADHTRP